MKNSTSILIADTQQKMQSHLDKILSREGYHIHCVSNGVEALAYLQDHKVDIVISDMDIPDMPGRQLVAMVKGAHPNVGVIAMTTSGNRCTVKDALLAGADEYLTKPFKNHEISVVVERAYWRILSAAKQLAR